MDFDARGDEFGLVPVAAKELGPEAIVTHSTLVTLSGCWGTVFYLDYQSLFLNLHLGLLLAINSLSSLAVQPRAKLLAIDTKPEPVLNRIKYHDTCSRTLRQPLFLTSTTLRCERYYLASLRRNYKLFRLRNGRASA